ncbi:unnamed protein product [Urochloa decumbens]|uniref:Transcription repressor n=1 Tax=Urochloa decumbens TaxID=240449 RepID=A0ABC8YGN9_9POAL
MAADPILYSCAPPAPNVHQMALPLLFLRPRPAFLSPAPPAAAASLCSAFFLSSHHNTQCTRAQPPAASLPTAQFQIRSLSFPVPMKVLMSRRRGAGGGLRIKKKARGFMCGCGGTKAVSISDGSDKQSPMATPQTVASTTPLTAASPATTTTTTSKARRAIRAGDNRAPPAAAAEAPSSFSSSSFYAETSTTTDDGPSSMDSTPSLSALLRQLGELERSVRGLATAGTNGTEPATGGAGSTKQNGGGGGGSRRHRRTVSDGCGGGCGRVEESVAVVKESADPLGDFRRSMLQMIVEKEIVGGDELRELLHRFLSLNSPVHHHLILRAFAEIWEEVFAGYERTPDFLAAHRRKNNKRPAAAAAATHHAAVALDFSSLC